MEEWIIKSLLYHNTNLIGEHISEDGIKIIIFQKKKNLENFIL